MRYSPVRGTDVVAHLGSVRTSKVTPTRLVTALDGTPLSVAQLLDRVFVDGALAALRCGFSSVQIAVWQHTVMAGAEARGMELTLDVFDGVVLLTDAAHEQRMHASRSGSHRHDRLSGNQRLARQRDADSTSGPQLRVIYGGRAQGRAGPTGPVDIRSAADHPNLRP
jgi:hypothetical protein